MLFPDLPFSLPDRPGYQWQWNPTDQLFDIDLPQGKLRFHPHFFPPDTCQFYRQYFSENADHLPLHSTDWHNFEKEKLSTLHFSHIQWRHDTLKMFGREVYQPRFTAWYGDPDRPYTYSGLTMQPEPWTPELIQLKSQIAPAAGVIFNSVLLNWYRDGEDYMGWHQDNEKELGQNPVIASVNFGVTRRFLLRRLVDKQEKVEIPLSDGSLLLMQGPLQHHWQHAVPKQKRIRGNRFNLTFRVIKL